MYALFVMIEFLFPYDQFYFYVPFWSNYLIHLPCTFPPRNALIPIPVHLFLASGSKWYYYVLPSIVHWILVWPPIATLFVAVDAPSSHTLFRFRAIHPNNIVSCIPYDLPHHDYRFPIVHWLVPTQPSVLCIFQ